MIKSVLMMYRYSKPVSDVNPHIGNDWKSWLVTDEDSHKTDGVNFDLIKDYQSKTADHLARVREGTPLYEIVLFPVEYPV